MTVTIRQATASDLPSIRKINHSLHVSERKDGFLVQKRKTGDFKKLLELCKYFLVAEEEGKIAGYMLVLDESADYLENDIFFHFVKNYDDFVFTDQVAVHPDFQRKGIGKKLYAYLMDLEQKRILLEIFSKPYNKQSVLFHEALGFKPNGDKLSYDGFEANIYEFKP